MSTKTIFLRTKLSENQFQAMFLKFTHLTLRLICWLTFYHTCALSKIFIYRSIMSDSIEPMDIEGEAVFAVRPQLVFRGTCCSRDLTECGYPWGRGQGLNPLKDPLLDVGEGVSDLLWIQFSRAHGGGQSARVLQTPSQDQRNNVVESKAIVRRIATYSAWRQKNWTVLKPAQPENKPCYHSPFI